VVFDKIAFVNFKISNNFKQKIDETHSKQPKIHRKIHSSPWISKISRKKSADQKFLDLGKCFRFPKRKPYRRV
jgi:hypothetical protein